MFFSRFIFSQADQDRFNAMTTEEDIHVLTGVLKLFFRELIEPLIPHRFIDKLLSATGKKK
jgi:hypothetical protein